MHASVFLPYFPRYWKCSFRFLCLANGWKYRRSLSRKPFEWSFYLLFLFFICQEKAAENPEPFRNVVKKSLSQRKEKELFKNALFLHVGEDGQWCFRSLANILGFKTSSVFQWTVLEIPSTHKLFEKTYPTIEICLLRLTSKLYQPTPKTLSQRVTKSWTSIWTKRYWTISQMKTSYWR